MILRGRHLLVLDTVSTVLSVILSFALRFDAPSDLFFEYVTRYWWIPLIIAPARVASLYAFRLYQRVWRYASIAELEALVGAIALSSAVAYAFVFWLVAFEDSTSSFPRSIPLLDAMIAVLFVGASRFSLRIAGVGRRGGGGVAGAQRTLVVGASATGAAVARQIAQDRSLGLTVVGFIDDDFPPGQRIFGRPVLGRTEHLGDAIERSDVGTVLLALPNADGKTIRRLVRLCEERGVRCLTVPSIAELVGGRTSPTTVREIKVDDLLRRAPARIDLDSVRGTVAEAIVLITGAGGSIGSELARQVSGLGCRELYLLGRGENSIFEIYQELRDRPGVHPVILDIREAERLERFLRTVRPTLVFHAAAHKHVGLMELHPEEALATNVVGTENLLRACESAGVVRFVQISTDKAVDPTSVMGATKRLAEQLTQRAALRTGRPYVSVRFGNVLSSRGSVIPIFQRQIARGGPITVTDAEATRYFMTIPEAVQLVLQAAVLGSGGEVFVLDMGEPVKILDLAKQLAELHDLELGVDLPVEFVGLRPGEKLHETLFLADEVPQRTSHENIFVARPEGARADMLDVMPRFRTLAASGAANDIRAVLAELIPTYRPSSATNARH